MGAKRDRGREIMTKEEDQENQEFQEIGGG